MKHLQWHIWQFFWYPEIFEIMICIVNHSLFEKVKYCDKISEVRSTIKKNISKMAIWFEFSIRLSKSEFTQVR